MLLFGNFIAIKLYPDANISKLSACAQYMDETIKCVFICMKKDHIRILQFL